MLSFWNLEHKKNIMEVKVKFANGTVRDAESVEAVLRGGHMICSPDLDNRLKQLICPEHGKRIDGITIEWKRLSEAELAAFKKAGEELRDPVVLLWHYSGTCNGAEVCETLSEIAAQVIDQDQERGMEFFLPGSDNQIF